MSFIVKIEVPPEELERCVKRFQRQEHQYKQKKWWQFWILNPCRSKKKINI